MVEKDIIEKVAKEKNPAAQARGKKAWETQLEKLKNQMVNEINATPSRGNDTPSKGNDTPSTSNATSSTGNATPSGLSNNIIYGLILLICGGGLAVFLSKKHVTAFLSKKPAPTESIKKIPKKIYME